MVTQIKNFSGDNIGTSLEQLTQSKLLLPNKNKKRIITMTIIIIHFLTWMETCLGASSSLLDVALVTIADVEYKDDNHGIVN